MPSLDLGSGDAAVLIDYIDQQSRAVRSAADPAGATVITPATAATLQPIVDRYLRIQRALNVDNRRDLKTHASIIAAEAATLGSAGAPVQAAAGELQRAVDLKAARTAFA